MQLLALKLYKFQLKESCLIHFGLLLLSHYFLFPICSSVPKQLEQSMLISLLMVSRNKMRQRQGRGGRDMGPLLNRGDFQPAVCGNSQLMNQPLDAETTLHAFLLPNILLSKGTQPWCQDAFIFYQLKSVFTNIKGKILEKVCYVIMLQSDFGGTLSVKCGDNKKKRTFLQYNMTDSLNCFLKGNTTEQ